MSERVRSTNTYKTMALVRYAVGGCRYEETTLTGPISEAHHQRGRRLRDARVADYKTLRDLTDAAHLPDFTYATLSQLQMGQVEATEDEWAALWAALGQPEPH